ncbi:MAG TPA: copper resistance protein CopC [Ilumatobacteraceae bacterium]|nr:copper resistance protein CopC [Ilumatobacteraceae bacterium]
MSRTRRAAWAVVAGALLATIFGVGRVAAHAELLSTDPQPGAVLDAGPARITLTFNEPVEISLGAVRVFDGRGTVIEVGAATHPDGRAETVVVDLPELANGSYVVDWRVVSADSHPLRAAFTFQVGPTSDLKSGLLDEIIAGGGTGGSAGTGLDISRGLVIVAMAIVFGGLLVCGLGIVPFGRKQQVAIGAAAAVGVVAGLLALPLEVGYTSGRSLGVITDWSAWKAVWNSTIGHAWVIRAAAIGVIAAALLATRARSRTTWWQVTAIVGVVVAGTASAYGGHGAAGRWHYLGVFLTMLHVSAMAVWLGGLLLVLLSFNSVDERGVTRFSGIALVAVATIVVSGAVQGVRQVGTLDALTGTSYGKLLIWKLIAVAVVLGVATVARQATHGRLLLASPAAGATLSAASGERIDRPRLRKAVGIEAALGVAIVVVTSLLMAANPSQATAAKPYSATLTSNGYLATITVAPARVGANEVHIYLSSPSSSLDRPDSVRVTIQDPSRDVNSIALGIENAGAGHYISRGATFAYAATWRLTVTARYDFDEIVFTADVKVT